ncbi:ABC transporter permease [Herbiconiux liukaitaii]|uniref:ABC transporter permease n=1 Tax=Herbiconiux liukaitaii TaxID=3342799 RepID=UPI0035B8C8AE
MRGALATTSREYGLRIIILVAVIATFLIISKGFSGPSSVYAVLESFAFVGIVALGLSVTMIAGELDLSVASTAALMGVIAIEVAQFGLVVAILTAVVGGFVLGALQGWLIAKLGINSLVFTAGSLIAIRGFAYIASDNAPVVLTDFEISDPLHARFAMFFSPSSIIAIIVFVILGVFLAYTRPGRHIYAIGGARTEAIAAGVPLTSSMTLAFGISGATAGLAGAIACLKGGSAAPEGFPDLLLLAVGAALIGGIGLYGGVGTIGHVVVGVAITGTLQAGMATLAAPSYLNNLVLGVLLVLLLVADFLIVRASRRRRLTRLRTIVATEGEVPTEALVSSGR